MDKVPGCPICHHQWEFLFPFNDEVYWTHYCHMALLYIGWRMDGKPVVIPEDCIYQNPPGREE